MAARAVNGGKKLDLLKPLNLIQNLGQPTTYAKEVCYVKLLGEFSPTKYTVKVLL